MLELLANLLQPYKDVIGTTAGAITIAQFFTGLIICKKIYNNKSTAGISGMPFIGGLVISILMFKYGLLLEDYTMLVVNAVAITLNAFYSIVYYIYSEDKTNEVFKPLSYGVGLIAVLVGYASWEDQSVVQFRYGMITTVLLMLLIASPLFDLKDIIERQDASAIPFPMVCVGTVVSFLWLLYGIVLLNNFMIVQNVLAFGLSIVQLVLCIIYPKRED